MTNHKARLLLLAVGLATAGTASAANITVYAKLSGTQSVPAAVGQVVSAPAGISCRTDGAAGCVGAIDAPSVTLTPSPVANAEFVSWTGCSSLAGTDCVLSGLTAASVKTVTAIFRPAQYPLSVKVYPVRTATVTPAYSGTLQIAGQATPCQNNGTGVCTAVEANGASRILTAVPAAGSKVASWSGCPAVSGADNTICTVPMNSPRFVSVTFGSAYTPIKAAVNGPGYIRVSTSGSVPDGLYCPDDCTGGHVGGTITLTAVPAAGAKMIGWTGCTGSGRSISADGLTCTFGNRTTAWPAASKIEVTASFKGQGCGTCHNPAPGHQAYSNNCGQCHTGYTATTVNAAQHVNGVKDAPVSTVPAQLPAGAGLSVELVDFDVVGGRIVYDFVMRDGAGATVDVVACLGAQYCFKSGNTSSGSGREARFALGKVMPDGSFDSVVLNAGVESQSETFSATTVSSLGNGVYRFTLPSSRTLEGGAFDAAASYRAVVYAGRFYGTTLFSESDYREEVGTSNQVSDETITDAACNSCHGRLTLHGFRRGVAACLTCHNPNMALGSVSVPFKWDLKTLAHKLHSGMNYDGINPLTGVQGTAWGTTFDASHMKMAPTHTTYFEGAGTATPGAQDDNTHDRALQTECKVCHQGTNANNYLVASRAACATCHLIDWTDGGGHGGTYPDPLPSELPANGGHAHPEASDANCAGCHPATYDPVIPYAVVPVGTVHSNLYEPATNVNFNQAVTFNGTSYPAVPGPVGAKKHVIDLTINAFSVNASGFPVIDVTITKDGAAYNDFLDALAAAASGVLTSNEEHGGRWPTCAFIVSGPNNGDYVVPATGSAQFSCTAAARWAVIDAGAGQYRFTSNASINTASFPPGTYTLSYEMMYQRQAGDSTTYIVRKPFAMDPKFYVLTKGGTDTAGTYALAAPGSTGARRSIVSYDKCNDCHIDLGFHSNRGRQGPDYCATCHNPKLDNGTRARVKVADAYEVAGLGLPAGTKVYLPESVSMNVFIHRIHMGSNLPSVVDPPLSSPWNPEPGHIVYGATRSAFVGFTATTPPEMADLTEFAQPNPMGNCNQCHTDIATNMANYWDVALAGTPTVKTLAPVERTYRLCVPTTVSWDTEQWCNNTANTGMPTDLDTVTSGVQSVKINTPPVKAVCTSCHDDLATDMHADAMTENPMTAGAVENCAGCHADGAMYDATRYHPNPIP